MNYSSFIVKIVEGPTRENLKNDIPVTDMLVKFSQIRDKKSLETFQVFVWGNLAEDVVEYYKINDYIIIEGYISLNRNFSKNIVFPMNTRNNPVQISVRKIYPFI